MEVGQELDTEGESEDERAAGSDTKPTGNCEEDGIDYSVGFVVCVE